MEAPGSNIDYATMTHVDTVKPLSRALRMRKVPPVRELPRRTDLLPLLEKYDVQAPRYTSYPPATQFRADFDGSRLLERIAHSSGGRGSSEISIYVHLPFCDTLCYFCGCNMLISNNRASISQYLSYLKREITLVASYFDYLPTVVQMHWGGGSPTHLLPSELRELGSHLRSVFDFSEQAEVSIEIDPRGLTKEHVEAMRTVGFNRASIGVQDFDPDVQIAINRIQSQELTATTVQWCREAGITSINLDLIYGLPFQSIESFGNTLRAVCEINPDRVAVYNFAYVPWLKPHQKLIQIETLPAASNKLALLELAIEVLTDSDAGQSGKGNLHQDEYMYLGMDHFAKMDDALVTSKQDGTLQRNFQGYSTSGGLDLLAFGISAIGRVENTYFQNFKELPAYYAAIDEGELPVQRGYDLTSEDALREFVIMRIMCEGSIRKRQVEILFRIDFDVHFASALYHLLPLQTDGLCELTSESVSVTELGRYFLRNIALVFDEYYQDAIPERMFSKAV